MTTVLKLGGSVITDKTAERTVDEPALEAIAGTIARDAPPSLVVAIGGGSFGHPVAQRHGVTASNGTHDPAAIAAIQRSMVALNGHVVDALHDADVPAVGLQPGAFAHRDDDGLHLATGALDGLLGEGFVPVVHGDGVVTEGAGVTVLSGDDLVVGLARRLDADGVGLLSDAGGVRDADGAVIDRITDFEAVAGAVGASDATDVTGGMARKVRVLLSLDREACVFDVDGLGAFLGGATPGTTVDPA